ncbi:transmembrane protein, putative (macronuclear) [Tetrahymena thermophila SB210]|uniref:Transmembrane protein, putative n=1 Tax=Tetrahymena thermophila (strain SB210) TaxID=312017 RepID=Q22NJ3_TETTS|nr:transmembrane protein, putative [Tetrahymena thermophila SB210]EAR86792.2 transmembrane protein, putative [Tetrahymena thermophila SB210]|eukprot:XP_001007037.2 transmembrane protein, putative [Tetrahymena thermophila SB210]
MNLIFNYEQIYLFIQKFIFLQFTDFKGKNIHSIIILLIFKYKFIFLFFHENKLINILNFILINCQFTQVNYLRVIQIKKKQQKRKLYAQIIVYIFIDGNTRELYLTNLLSCKNIRKKLCQKMDLKNIYYSKCWIDTCSLHQANIIYFNNSQCILIGEKKDVMILKKLNDQVTLSCNFTEYPGQHQQHSVNELLEQNLQAQETHFIFQFLYILLGQNQMQVWLS